MVTHPVQDVILRDESEGGKIVGIGLFQERRRKMFFKRSSKRAALDERVKQIANAIIKEASTQSFKLKVNITEEAQKIGTSCGILKKQHHPANFVDIGLQLLTYPRELAFTIAVQFSNYESQLGFNPFGTIMLALSQIDSFYQGMLVRTQLLKKNPELFELINSKPARIQKAGEFVATAMLASSETVKGARAIYHNNVIDPSVKEVTDRELAEYDAEIAREIIR